MIVHYYEPAGEPTDAELEAFAEALACTPLPSRIALVIWGPSGG
jgi:hypothetical protein